MTGFRWAMLVIVMVPAFGSQAGCVTLSALMGKKKSPELDPTLLRAQGYSIPPGGMPAQVEPNEDQGPRIVLEVRGDGQERHVESVPMPMDKAVFLQDMVQQAQLQERLGRIRVAIMRPVGGEHPPIRLDAAIDDKGKTSSLSTNYALLPGDHLIVYADQRTMLSRFLDDQFGS